MATWLIVVGALAGLLGGLFGAVMLRAHFVHDRKESGNLVTGKGIIITGIIWAAVSAAAGAAVTIGMVGYIILTVVLVLFAAILLLASSNKEAKVGANLASSVALFGSSLIVAMIAGLIAKKVIWWWIIAPIAFYAVVAAVGSNGERRMGEAEQTPLSDEEDKTSDSEGGEKPAKKAKKSDGTAIWAATFVASLAAAIIIWFKVF